MVNFSFLGADEEFHVDPQIIEGAKNAQKGEWGTVTAGVAAAACAATGAGAAIAPVCAAVGNWLGQTFIGAFNAVNAGYEEQKANQSAITAAGNYLDELKQLRDESLRRTIGGLVQFGRNHGWSSANDVDVAVQLAQLGANITNVPINARTNELPSGVLISTATLQNGGPYFSGPLPCSGPPPHRFLKCTGGSCGPGGGGQFVVNDAYMQCMVNRTNEWAGQLEIAATFLGANILGGNAIQGIQIKRAPLFQMKSSSGMSTTTKVVGGAAVLGGGWWLLTKLGWL